MPIDLTPREAEIVEYILEGYNNLAIAMRLEMSEQTLKRHIYNIFVKQRVGSRLELAVTLLKARHAEEIGRLSLGAGKAF